MICGNCGKRNKKGARFCENCGNMLDGVADKHSGISSNLIISEPINSIKNKSKGKRITTILISALIIISVCIIICSRLGDAYEYNPNILQGTKVAEDGGWIYYGLYNEVYSEVDSYSGEAQDLVKSRPDGSDLQHLTSGNDTAISSIFITEDWIYFVKETYGIYRIKKDGSQEECYDSGNAICGIVNDKIYYLSRMGEGGDRIEEQSDYYRYASNAICCGDINADSSRKIVLYLAPANSIIKSAFANPEGVYFVEEQIGKTAGEYRDAIFMQNEKGNTDKILEGEDNVSILNMSVANDKIYFNAYFEIGSTYYEQASKIDEEKLIAQNGEGEALFCVSTDKKDEKSLLYIIEDPYYIVTDSCIYFYDCDESRFNKLDINAGDKVKKVSSKIPEEHYIKCIQFIDGCIYYFCSTEEGEALYRVKTDSDSAKPELVAQGKVYVGEDESEAGNEYDVTEEFSMEAGFEISGSYLDIYFVDSDEIISCSRVE